MTSFSEHPLAMADCRRACSWSPSGEQLGADPVFVCAGCGSEWVRSEAWTPIDAMGEVPEAVVDERARAL